jgi:hypothetical protein
VYENERRQFAESRQIAVSRGAKSGAFCEPEEPDPGRSAVARQNWESGAAAKRGGNPK